MPLWQQQRDKCTQYLRGIAARITHNNMTVSNKLQMPRTHSKIDISSAINSGTSYTQQLDSNVVDSGDGMLETPCSTTENPLLRKDPTTEPKPKWYTSLKPPYAMLIMSSIQICIFVFINNKKMNNALIFDPLNQQELWRFISYMFLHKDWVHLVQNVLLQCLFGAYLERVQGSWKILFVYVGGGIGGALGAAAWRSDLLLGASAGVYALLLSILSNVIVRFPNVRYKYKLSIAVAIIIICDVIYCLFHYFYNVSPTISGAAHTFGAIIGFLIGLVLFSSDNLVSSRLYSKIIYILSVILLILFFFGLIIADVKKSQRGFKVKYAQAKEFLDV